MEGKRKPRAAELLSGMVKAVAEFEGKRVEVVNEELGEAIRRGGAALERYRNGRIPLRDPGEVRYLAQMGLTRGLLSASWLREFLHATGYPHPEALVAELAGAASVATPVPPVSRPWYDNLGLAPFGGTFVARRELLAELLATMVAVPITVLIGMGGMGKTSMAYHLATLCREQWAGSGAVGTARLPGTLPAVQAVIWVSDAAHAGSTTPATILDAIARTLDHPGLTIADAKEDAVRTLLTVTPTLLIIDNAETIRDEGLLPWLLTLPPSTRVLITTRQMAEGYLDERVKALPLGGLTDPEARRLIKDQAKYLGLEHLDPAAQQALIQRTGRCPQALKQMLGYAKRARQPLGAVLAQFDALAGDLLADLFTHCWDTVLGEEARRLLITLSCARAPLARVALSRCTGFAPSVLDAAILQVSDVALTEVHARPEDAGEPRFGLHPLTQAFVAARRPNYAPFVASTEARLISWAADYADGFGYQVSDLAGLARLEADELLLMQALRDAAASGQQATVVRLAKGLEFFYYIGCRWDDKLELHAYYIAAAEELQDVGEQICALTMHIQLLCRLGRLEEAELFLERLAPLSAAAAGGERFHVRHARALYAYTQGDHPAAQVQWSEIVEQAATWGLPDHMTIGALHWLGLSCAQTGDAAMAQRFFSRSLALAQQGSVPIDRWVARNQIQLAGIDISQQRLAQAGRRLTQARELLVDTDREQLAHLLGVEGRLHEAQGRAPEARAAIQEAQNLFRRMGLRQGWA